MTAEGRGSALFRLSHKGKPMPNNQRDDEIDVTQIERNRRVALDSTQNSPFMEEIEAGDADYGERLYDQMPEDRVGFLTNGHRRK